MAENVISTSQAVAKENSTFALTVRYFDENNSPTVPTSANWTLLNEDYEVVNSRANVTISSLSTISTIVLTGDDLPIIRAVGVTALYFQIDGEYNSGLGSGLKFNDRVKFFVEPVNSN